MYSLIPKNTPQHKGRTLPTIIKILSLLFLVARDRTKSTVSKVACMGRVVKTKVDGMIGYKLTPNNVLVTDAWRAYKTYANEKGIEHYRIKSDDGKHVIKGLYHIQNVNGLHSRLRYIVLKG